MLDTLRYSKRLQSAGVDREQADAQAEAINEAIADSVATKSQLDGVEQRISGELRQVSAEIKTLRWTVGLLAGLVTAVLVKLLLM